MRYRMKQKFFALADSFVVQDGDGQDAFRVDGAAFALGHKLAFHDLQGRELAFISQKLLAWGPTYEVYRDGALAAVVKKKLFTFVHCKFSVDVPGPDDLIAEGNFLDMEYTFRRGDAPVATVSKQWFAMTDTYGIDIADGQDDVLLLATAVVIDLCCHPDDKKN